jgi:hypothetical protein
MSSGIPAYLGAPVKHIWTENLPKRPDANSRGSERRVINIPARLTWKDQSGATRFASVVTRNVSDIGVFVECPSPLSIPLYRLVQLQLERDVREVEAVPGALQQGRVLSAVYRVSPPSKSKPQGLALRLMVAPVRALAVVEVEQARATA